METPNAARGEVAHSPLAAQPRVERAERELIETVRSALSNGAPAGGFLVALTRALDILEEAERDAGIVRHARAQERSYDSLRREAQERPERYSRHQDRRGHGGGGRGRGKPRPARTAQTG